VPLVGKLPVLLAEHRKRTAGQPNPHNLVWHHHDGRPISHKDDHELWQELLVRAGVRVADGPPVPHHRCRHTTATLLLDAGVDSHIVYSVIGHSDVAMTRSYQLVDLTLARQAFNNLSSLVD
jgi:site-specific recombinase XerD